MSGMREELSMSNARFEHLEERISQLEPSIRTQVMNQVVTQASPMIAAQVASQLQEALANPQLLEALANRIRPAAPPSIMSGIEAMGVPAGDASGAPPAQVHGGGFSFQQPSISQGGAQVPIVVYNQMPNLFRSCVPWYNGSNPGNEKVSSYNFIKAVEAYQAALEQPTPFRQLIIQAASRFVEGGKAKVWYNTRIASSPFPSWQVFKDEFLASMRSMDESVQLRLRLRALIMSGNLFEYIAEFQNIVYQLNSFPNTELHITKADQVMSFAEGLPLHLRAKIDLGQASLDEAISRVVNRENTQLTQKAFNAAFPARNGSRRVGRGQLYQMHAQPYDPYECDDYGSDMEYDGYDNQWYGHDEDAELAAVVTRGVGRRGRGSRAPGRGRGRVQGRGPGVSANVSSNPRGGSNPRGRGRGGRGRGRAEGGRSRSEAWGLPEAAARKADGVCVGCGQPGHFLRTCPLYGEPDEENFQG